MLIIKKPMFIIRGLCASCFLVLCAFNPLFAQSEQSVIGEQIASQAGATVTASATAERVRFTAPSNVVRMQLQVISESGQVVFDVSSKGNVLDWSLQDSSGQRLQGSFMTVVTVKSLSGRVSEKIGSVSVMQQEVELKATEASGLMTAQMQTVGPIEENSGLTILQPGEADAVTTVAHDGTQGEVTRSRGALSFRLGDFFSGKDEEQMRLTEEGNLGIGTDNPQAKLDVAGVIRTRDGIEFGSGEKTTKLTTTANGSLQQTMADGTVVPNATGTGTQDRIAKWTDSAGTLGDSLLRESSGRIEVLAPAAGSGVTPSILNPNNVPGFAQFQFYPAAGPNSNMSFTVVPRGTGAANNRAQFSIFGTDLFADATNYEFASLRARDTDFVLGTGKSGSGQTRPLMLAAGFLGDNITNNGQLYLAANGDVGVGKTNPGAKLDVAGNINTSTQYNIGSNRVLSVSGAGAISLLNSNTFAGVGAGPNSTPDPGGSGNNNSFFGRNAGFSNTLGTHNSFFGRSAGESSIFTVANSFFGAFAGQSNTSSSNSFFGEEAGFLNTNGSANSFFGRFAGDTNGVGISNTIIGFLADVGSANLFNATAIGANAQVTQNNSLVLGSINTINGATTDTKVGIGTTAPSFKLHVISSNVGLRVENTLSGGTLASFGGTGFFQVDAPNVTGGRFTITESGNVGIGEPFPNATLEVKVGGTTLADAWTTRSSARFKTNIQPIPFALAKVLQLRGVTFDYKNSQKHSLGFIAEEVGRVLPEVVVYEANGKDAIGLDYNKLSPIVVEAIKEQQQTIVQLKQENTRLKARIADTDARLKVRNVETESRLANLETTVKQMRQNNRRPRDRRK